MLNSAFLTAARHRSLVALMTCVALALPLAAAAMLSTLLNRAGVRVHPLALTCFLIVTVLAHGRLAHARAR